MAAIMETTMEIRFLDIRYARNGCFGAGFYRLWLEWTCDDGCFTGIAIVFDADEHIAIIADNSRLNWRYEDFAKQCRAYIETHEAQARAFSDAPAEPANDNSGPNRYEAAAHRAGWLRDRTGMWFNERFDGLKAAEAHGADIYEDAWQLCHGEQIKVGGDALLCHLTS